MYVIDYFTLIYHCFITLQYGNEKPKKTDFKKFKQVSLKTVLQKKTIRHIKKWERELKRKREQQKSERSIFSVFSFLDEYEDDFPSVPLDCGMIYASVFIYDNFQNLLLSKALK